MNLLPSMERIVQLHRDRAVAIGVALGAALLMVVLTDSVGSMSWFGLVLTIAAAVVVLGNSDSFAGLVLLGAMIVQWTTSGMAADTWSTLPAAWLMLVAHVAIAVVSSGPDQAPIPRDVLALWVPRTVLVAAVTAAVAVVTFLIEPTNDQRLSYAAAAVLIALVAAVVVLTRFISSGGTPETDRPGSRYESMYERTRPTRDASTGE